MSEGGCWSAVAVADLGGVAIRVRETGIGDRNANQIRFGPNTRLACWGALAIRKAASVDRWAPARWERVTAVDAALSARSAGASVATRARSTSSCLSRSTSVCLSRSTSVCLSRSTSVCLSRFAAAEWRRSAAALGPGYPPNTGSAIGKASAWVRCAAFRVSAASNFLAAVVRSGNAGCIARAFAAGRCLTADRLRFPACSAACPSG